MVSVLNPPQRYGYPSDMKIGFLVDMADGFLKK
jgi:hypothetical protein